jgi:ATP-binding cassette subfamily C protein
MFKGRGAGAGAGPSTAGLFSAAPGSPIAQALAACRRHFVFAVVFSALVNLLYLAPTLYMMQVYDRVVATGGITTLVFISAVVVFALGTLSLLDKIRTRLLVRAGLRLDRILAGEVLSRLFARPAGAQGSARVSQAMREFDVFRQALTGPAALAVFDAPWTPIYLFFTFLLHPLLGVLTLFGGVGLFLLAVANERATKSKLQKAQEAAAGAYMAQETATANGDVVRALGMRRAMVARQLTERGKATQLQAEAQFAGGGYSGMIKFLRLVLQSLALGVGAWLAVERQISAGAIIAASVLLSRALQPIEQIVGAWGGIVAARAAFATVKELLDEESPDAERTKLPDPKGALRVEGAVVRAPTGAVVLKGISFAVKPGEFLGIVGPSGGGKTTLARVIAGAVRPDQGAVRIDGADYKDWNQDRLSRFIGYLPQDSALFAGTVRDNISRFEGWTGADREAVDEKVVAAAKVAGAHELILQLPKGYDTPLGLGGRGLSAGQMQRVALARALYGDPTLVILDEPNAFLDAEGEGALMQALAALKQRGASIVVIAHRTGVLSQADSLLVVANGAIDLHGPKDEVIAKLGQREAARKPPSVATIVRSAGGPA